MNNLPYHGNRLANPLRQLFAVLATAALVGVALMFSIVVVAVILVGGAIGWSYLWWKTREMRKQMAGQPLHTVMGNAGRDGDAVVRGVVIEGEAVRVDDTIDERD